MPEFLDVTNQLGRECGHDLLHSVSTHFRRRERSPIRAPFDWGKGEVVPGAVFNKAFSMIWLLEGGDVCCDVSRYEIPNICPDILPWNAGFVPKGREVVFETIPLMHTLLRDTP